MRIQATGLREIDAHKVRETTLHNSGGMVKHTRPRRRGQGLVAKVYGTARYTYLLFPHPGTGGGLETGEVIIGQAGENKAVSDRGSRMDGTPPLGSGTKQDK